ncbi:hypothetical protein [Streptomyces griseorubiginosus]|uniref:Lipoprotein n=1 Tax=Streptomyces griseorubiginosus TaxID=67304 RepID=A0AAI8L1C5_9ACTN|nr:hypothetical protein [Streptomyces griseorubiginosus]AYC39568.1 hypothetical protein DWG14_03808 [Streptomyces griseorubiginosus]KUM67360.1 hypothetical protein AQI84_41200 [Streptomyces griseorubiginosus]
MTTANFSRPVSRRRAGLAAAGLTGVLVLTACSGGGGSDDGSSPSASVPPSASASGSTGGSGGTSSSASGKVAGSWLTTGDGKAVVLVVNGDKAALFTTGGSVCSGTASTETIRLKCPDGSKERTVGTVESVGKTSLKVRWQGSLGTESFMKAEGGKLPSDFPTAGLGS